MRAVSSPALTEGPLDEPIVSPVQQHQQQHRHSSSSSSNSNGHRKELDAKQQQAQTGECRLKKNSNEGSYMLFFHMQLPRLVYSKNLRKLFQIFTKVVAAAVVAIVVQKHRYGCRRWARTVIVRICWKQNTGQSLNSRFF